MTDPSDDTTTLLSDEPTIELIIRARRGDSSAVEAILQRCLPPLTRWAHGRLPAAARGALDTAGLVQEAAMSAIARLDSFEPRRVGAMQAYLRQSAINLIRDEMRRLARRPAAVELPPEIPSRDPSPLDEALEHETYDRYRQAMSRLKPRERELVIARVEAQWSIAEIAGHFGFITVDAARVAVHRAVQKLSALIEKEP